MAHRSRHELFFQAMRALHMTQKDLSEALGVSERTGQRWAASGSGMPPFHMPELARLVHPADPRLAAEIAAANGQTLQSLGLAPAAAATSATAAPPPPAPAPAPLPARALGDSVVCAAARVANVPPDAQHAPTLAGFRRAKELGMSVDEVIAALTPSKKGA